MKVFNLACEHDHRFEGWFGSADDYDAQLARGLLECPMCANRTIRKLPAAPRLNLSGATDAPAPRQRGADDLANGVPATSPDPRAVQAMFMKMARAVIANTEDVGERFAEEARRIHYREAPERGIRGLASKAEAQALEEEGINVMPLPFGHLLKDPLQ